MSCAAPDRSRSSPPADSRSVVTQPAPVTLAAAAETLPVGETPSTRRHHRSRRPRRPRSLDTVAGLPHRGAGRGHGPDRHHRSGTASSRPARRRVAEAGRRLQRQPVQGQVTLIQGGYEQTIDKYLQSGKGEPPRPRADARVHGADDDRHASRRCRSRRASKPSNFDTAPFLRRRAAGATRRQDVQWACRSTSATRCCSTTRRCSLPPGSTRTSRRRRSTICAPTARRSSTRARRSTGWPSISGFDSGGGWYIEQWFAKLGEFYADNENGRRRGPPRCCTTTTPASICSPSAAMINDGLAVNVGDNASGFDNLLKLADNDRAGGDDDRHIGLDRPGHRRVERRPVPAAQRRRHRRRGRCPGPTGSRARSSAVRRCGSSTRGDDARTAATWDFLTVPDRRPAAERVVVGDRLHADPHRCLERSIR